MIVTPLDVVRVRQQSQPQLRLQSAAPAFANLPPNLGMTACCREVFWVNNASPYCIASSSAVMTPNSHYPNLSAADCAVNQTRRDAFDSIFGGLRKIARNEGLTSLWRGLSPTLVMAVPANLIYFTGYDYLRHDRHSPIRKYVSSAYAPLLAGSLARIAAAATISPIEMFRTRMQAAPGSRHTGRGVFSETLSGLQRMAQTEGYSSLWRGLTLTMWRDVPFSGIYWWGYESGRDILSYLRGHPQRPGGQFHREHAVQSSTFIDSFLAGALSGAIASVVTTPFDVGKTRRQVVQLANRQDQHHKPTYLAPEDRSMPRFLYHIWKEEGLAGLFKGWAARTLKVAPACAIMISSYEIGKKMARTMNEKQRLTDLG